MQAGLFSQGCAVQVDGDVNNTARGGGGIGAEGPKSGGSGPYRCASTDGHVVSSCTHSVTLSRFSVILSMLSDPLITYSLRIYLLLTPLHNCAILGPAYIILYNKIHNIRLSSLSRYIEASFEL